LGKLNRKEEILLTRLRVGIGHTCYTDGYLTNKEDKPNANDTKQNPVFLIIEI